MAGLDQEQDPTRENARHEAVRVVGPDVGLRLLQAWVAEQCRDEVRGAPPAPSSCLLCAEELGSDGVVVRHRGLVLAFGCLDCLRTYLVMTDVPRTDDTCCTGTTARCSPASEWCV